MIIRTLIAQQKLSAVFRRASRNNTNFDGVGVGEIDRFLVAGAGTINRCLSATHRHSMTAGHTLFDHCIYLFAPAKPWISEWLSGVQRPLRHSHKKATTSCMRGARGTFAKEATRDNINTHTNTLSRSFSLCSTRVKITLFRPICIMFYGIEFEIDTLQVLYTGCIPATSTASIHIFQILKILGSGVTSVVLKLTLPSFDTLVLLLLLLSTRKSYTKYSTFSGVTSNFAPPRKETNWALLFLVPTTRPTTATYHHNTNTSGCMQTVV